MQFTGKGAPREAKLPAPFKGGAVVTPSQSSCEDGPEAAACPFLPFLSLSRRTISHSQWSQPHNQHQVDAIIIPPLELWRGLIPMVTWPLSVFLPMLGTWGSRQHLNPGCLTGPV
jgi:hypothetical protein